MEERQIPCRFSLIACFFPILRTKHRVIHKFLRDFRPLRYSSRDGHAEGEHVNRGRDTPSFCPTLQVLDISTLGDAADVWQELDYRIDICRVTKGGHIEHLKGSTEIWSVSPSVDMLPFGVTIPATAQQRSEIAEGLMDYPVFMLIFFSQTSSICVTRL